MPAGSDRRCADAVAGPALRPGLVPAAYVVAMRGAVHVCVQVLVRLPDRQVDDYQRIAGLRRRTGMRGARLESPDETWRLVGQPVRWPPAKINENRRADQGGGQGLLAALTFGG